MEIPPFKDMNGKQPLQVWHQEGCYPGGPVFVPRPSTPASNSAEDDGVLLSIVFDAALSQSFLLILDAKSLGELVRARLPYIVPLAFGHGQFMHSLPKV